MSTKKSFSSAAVRRQLLAYFRTHNISYRVDSCRNLTVEGRAVYYVESEQRIYVHLPLCGTLGMPYNTPSEFWRKYKNKIGYQREWYKRQGIGQYPVLKALPLKAACVVVFACLLSSCRVVNPYGCKQTQFMTGYHPNKPMYWNRPSQWHPFRHNY